MLFIKILDIFKIFIALDTENFFIHFYILIKIFFKKI